MQVEKISVSLPAPLVQFVEAYKSLHKKKTRSEVIEEAVKLLREQELEKAYREANQEIDESWDIVVADGLTDETW
ncbi:CopG family transcriptional regulator [Iningainema sp. BLCCT55]|uniref:CopG family transcriptional regulator n=1 Tax=Iningainema tapete BLCC-T55 TaxID=2748662 RepID=A0A8J6XKH2_9CYAN|nr:ribbon-helix-helix domain-containing protein [Iningainema tapete]MBD2774266.1 CopG family transcriptional regulator [Iningainema tapete BLCC-T55]